MLTTVIIIALLISGGLSIKAIWRNSQLPEWTKQKADSIWGIAFFDKRIWLKRILLKIFRIKILQPIIISGIFLFKIVQIAFQTAKKIIFPKRI